MVSEPGRHPREERPPLFLVLALVLWGVLVWWANR